MTTVTVTTEIPPRGKTEDNSALYESTSAHIIEETEYVKKIRTTLEKIRNQIFKDDIGHNSANHKLDIKHCGNTQNGCDSEMDSSCCSWDLLMERVKGKNLQLVEMNKENEVLKIKLEASREAGAEALRNVAQRLFETYQTQSAEVRKKYEDSKRLLQVNKLEKEQKLKQHVENLNQVAEKLEEKHNQITELENLVQRMEREKRTLLGKKLSLENKLLQLKSNATYTKRLQTLPAPRLDIGVKREPRDSLLCRSLDPKVQSCQGLQKEISLLQEQISHLQFVIHSQHQNLRSVIQEMEGLKNNLREQDKQIENLKEKVNILEAQNKELKSKVALWSETPRTVVSQAVSTSELKTEGSTPYLMLIRLRK
ncbi:coiled-coil domain-containing protein 68 isoform X1 [Manis pentadactyla]|uniref:coiled-coil domain-containing protein 68 isoform X1 n=2 Tax=Manis pentadactyla TaxID=143292 RepID=UPI00255D0596|nr:coiled-coil domain-containing protein 68 isoform X1 [Manis pentadactyla]XP_057360177.1 coiled-coil domain-containing protein 68 isoform X1 [Manis pentadactyla]XP_057360178.1 coiled-coil domain-containing protein 68 isoform X1 [Manis pentadactyla]XP_057360179.1 coiled-coil domain-containing protein 68 isoform X1 [Manis pentadactyla]XP_057360180.1 coiled-coil domain-containing protein 68 isoform X1 [Manis pentadactyla]XP_057360181.1 coiled-coil domain-containing protein 68 isoform X1 [Manis p